MVRNPLTWWPTLAFLTADSCSRLAIWSPCPPCLVETHCLVTILVLVLTPLSNGPRCTLILRNARKKTDPHTVALARHEKANSRARRKRGEGATYRRQFGNDNAEDGEEVDDEVGQVIVGVVRAQEEENDGDAK